MNQSINQFHFHFHFHFHFEDLFAYLHRLHQRIPRVFSAIMHHHRAVSRHLRITRSIQQELDMREATFLSNTQLSTRLKREMTNVLLAGLTQHLHVGGVHGQRTDDHGVVGVVVILNEGTDGNVGLGNGVLWT